MSSHRLDMAGGREVCTFCPKLCRHACPTAEAERTEQATPTFKQQVALRAAAEGAAPLSPERARVLYKCTDCGATSDACRHRIDVGGSLREARALAVRQGAAPPEVEWLAQRFAEHGSPYGLDLARALELAAPGGRSGSGALGLMPACTALAHFPEDVRAAHTVLERAGAGARLALPSPGCCGYPLQAAGLRDAFTAHAARVSASLGGFERIVTQGAACAWTLSVRYPEVGVRGLRAAPLVDLLAEHADRWRDLAAEPAAESHAYHDPCFLARRLGRTEEPRAVLRAALGREVVELPDNRARTQCSGGGGVYPLTHPGPAASCAGRVGAAFEACGADVLVTACPSARRRISQAAPALPVRSLVGVLAERTGATRT